LGRRVNYLAGGPAIGRGILAAWSSHRNNANERGKQNASQHHENNDVCQLLQNEFPGKDKEANWLAAPKGPFSMYLRLYWPKAEAMDGKWTAPSLKRAQ
jgi:hypothetical protein